MSHNELQHVAFLNSWSNDCARGSGTAVAISHLRSGLEQQGVEVEAVMSELGSTDSLAGRIHYNLRISRLAGLSSYDSVIGFDMDGVFARTRSASYCVCLKGVARDEARFEQGWARLKLLLLASLEKRNAAKADRVIVTSNYCRQIVLRHYGVPAAKLSIVPESIDLEGRRKLAEQIVTGPRNGHLRILSVARQYRRKDTETLLRTFKRLVERRKDVSLRIVGEGPELQRLQSLANRLGVEREVTFLGSIESPRKMIREYLEADLFCLPSLQEGFGIVFLEAMDAGLPIVAARAGAVPEVVAKDEVGLLFTPGDSQELAECLELLLESPNLRREMGEKGKIKVRPYALDKVAAQFAQHISPVPGSSLDLEGARGRRALVDSKVLS